MTPQKDIWNYCELLQICHILEDHLVVILQLPLGDKFQQMHMYQTYNQPILYPQSKQIFQYYLEGEYLDAVSDWDYVTIHFGLTVLTYTSMKRHMC